MKANGRHRNGQKGRANGKRRKVRYAVIGLGYIAQAAMLPAFAHARENSELVALLSSDKKKLRELAHKYHVAFTGSYDDMESVLKDANVDAAYIALPNSQHRAFTERLARLGIHVLCEKPMAMTSRDCEAMIRATERHGVKLMIAYRLHFDRANLAVVDVLRKEKIGAPLVFSSVFAHQVKRGDIRTRGELGGGALYDMGIYCVNAARYLFAAEPEEVLGTQLVGTDARFPDVDATSTAILRFPHDRLAQFTASQGAADIGEYRVLGTKGDVRLDPAYEYVDELKEFLTVDGKTKKSTFPKSDQFAPELVYFSKCILEDREPEPSGWEGLADVRVLEAIARSSKLGKAVKLRPMARKRRPTPRMAMKKPPVGKVDAVRASAPSR
jgi:predicted dehydrogenase